MGTKLNYMDLFLSKQNIDPYKELHKYVADVLAKNKIRLDNVFFVRTPGFLAFLSELDGSIIDRPASEYSGFLTRNVIIEKCKKERKFNCFFHRNVKNGDKIISKPLSVMSYRLDWNKTIYGEEYDAMKSLKRFIESKSHLPIFIYVDYDFLEQLQETQIIRIATLDTSGIVVA